MLGGRRRDRGARTDHSHRRIHAISLHSNLAKYLGRSRRSRSLPLRWASRLSHLTWNRSPSAYSLRAATAGEPVVAVCHAGVIMASLRVLFDIPHPGTPPREEAGARSAYLPPSIGWLPGVANSPYPPGRVRIARHIEVRVLGAYFVVKVGHLQGTAGSRTLSEIAASSVTSRKPMAPHLVNPPGLSVRDCGRPGNGPLDLVANAGSHGQLGTEANGDDVVPSPSH